jgi:Zn-dependent M32 family carboxypeptidase
MITSPRIAALLKNVTKSQDYDSLDMIQKRNVHLVKKEHDEATVLPEELVVETARQTAITINTWKKALKHKGFSFVEIISTQLFDITFAP